MTVDDQQFELLRALTRHGVEFVVVGGVGAQIHGWRATTIDLDIAVDIADRNADRLNRALAEVGAGVPTIGAFGSAFETAFGRLEIVRKAHAVGGYDEWSAGAAELELEEGLTVFVAAAEDILRSKEAAGRPKDLEALEGMREDFRRSGALN